MKVGDEVRFTYPYDDEQSQTVKVLELAAYINTAGEDCHLVKFPDGYTTTVFSGWLHKLTKLEKALK